MPEEPQKKEQEPEAVDITSAALPRGLEVDIDPEDDAWEFGPPPPKGCYPLKLAFQVAPPKSWKKGNTRDGQLVYSTTLEGRVALEGDYEGTVTFLDIRTSLRRGKRISTAAGLIAKCGFKLKPRLDDLTVARMVTKLVAQGPTIVADCDWDAYSAADEKTILRGMDNFPDLPDGTKDHVVKDSKGNECFARLRVVHIYGKGEEHPAFGPSKSGASKPSKEKEEIDLTPANSTARVAPSPTAKQQQQARAEPSPGDEVELLED